MVNNNKKSQASIFDDAFKLKRSRSNSSSRNYSDINQLKKELSNNNNGANKKIIEVNIKSILNFEIIEKLCE